MSMWLCELRYNLDLMLNILFPFVLLATEALYLNQSRYRTTLSSSLNRYLVLDNHVLGLVQITLTLEVLQAATVITFAQLSVKYWLDKRFPMEENAIMLFLTRFLIRLL